MKFSAQEIDALVAVLDYYVPDLHAEISRTGDRPLRARLRDQEALLIGLRQRLLDERRGSQRMSV